MNLTPIKANMTQVRLTGGLTVLFSYQTPVACVWTNSHSQTFYKTNKKWSATTTRHINQWIVLRDEWGTRDFETRPQEYFDSLILGVK